MRTLSIQAFPLFGELLNAADLPGVSLNAPFQLAKLVIGVIPNQSAVPWHFRPYISVLSGEQC
jgi:hypothetical protein